MSEGSKIIQIEHLKHKITQQYIQVKTIKTTKTSYQGTDHNRWSKAAPYRRKPNHTNRPKTQKIHNITYKKKYKK